MHKKTLQIMMVAAVLLAASAFVLQAKWDVPSFYGPFDKEYYLTDAQLLFIRPGLELEILDVAIPEDLRTVVTFSIQDPRGLPLDIDGIFTPGPVSASFILARIPAGENQYVAYTTRTQTSPITGASAEQASSDSGGTTTKVEDGIYMYRFGTALPADFDRDATHTVGVYARRDLREFGLDRYADNALHHLVPSGISEPAPRDVVRTAACNQCHNPLALHGGARLEVGLCVLCHNPQSVDPDTGNTVDLKVMVHKIHRGENLPSVEAGTPYQIIGFRQSVHDYSHVAFPQDIRNCQNCHIPGQSEGGAALTASPNPVMDCDATGVGQTTLEWNAPNVSRVELRVGSPTGNLLARGSSTGSATTGMWVRNGLRFYLLDASNGNVIDDLSVGVTVLGCDGAAPQQAAGAEIIGGSQSAAWVLRPSMAACGACHDDVNFATGVNHPGGPQSSNRFCSNCHFPEGELEFDASIMGAHTVPYRSRQLRGLFIQILDIVDTFPGQSPTVLFRIVDGDGRRIAPSDLSSFSFNIAGPTSDYSTLIRESQARTGSAPMGNGDFSYTFSGQLPDDAEGTFTIGAEGRRSVMLNPGTTSEMSFNESAENPLVHFSVTDEAPVPRRMVVSDEKCERCHDNLEFHGSLRHNPQYCVTCHQPPASDVARRPDEALPVQSIHFKFMIHRIHKGEELTRDFTVYGFGNRPHNYNELLFPGDLRDCATCHVNNSYEIPLSAGALPTTAAPREFFQPLQPIAAACLSCHDSREAAAHAATNTAPFGEACVACHGSGMEFAVERVHAR